jgi:hypothetical protein
MSPQSFKERSTPMDNEILCKEFEKHFNEPVLTVRGLGRVIGYGEDEYNCYLIVQYSGGRSVWHTAVGGYFWLTRLRGQDQVTSTDGKIWDDFTRLSDILELNGAPKQEKFLIESN